MTKARMPFDETEPWPEVVVYATWLMAVSCLLDVAFLAAGATGWTAITARIRIGNWRLYRRLESCPPEGLLHCSIASPAWQN
jgi:hypothetical protein